MDKINVWRKCHSPSFGGWDQNKSFQRFCILEVNRDLPSYVKRASLVAAPSVVAIRVYSGGSVVFWGSGFVIECDSEFQTTIITSATLFRADATSNILVDNLNVIVVLQNGIECHGQVEACDFHFNLAAIRIQANCQVAKLNYINDFIVIDPRRPHHHSSSSNLIPGESLIALGRYHNDDREIMVAPGEFSAEDCSFDCKELFKSTSRITKCGIGGPLINRKGELIGVNFFAVDFTPFLPVTIIVKWLEHFKKFGDYRRPWVGIKLSNLFTADLFIWEKIVQKFPNIKGVIVDEVTPNSPARSAAVESQDIIIECDGKPVEGCLQFFDLICEKVGNPVDLVIARLDGSHHNLSVMVADINHTQFNSWPVPESLLEDE